PGPDGLTTLEQLKRRAPDVPVIMMSGKATLTDAVRATKLGAFQFLEKPLTPEGVLVAIRSAIELSRTLQQNRRLHEALGHGDPERRLGRFELADGGTLFLDEVGDLGHEAQAKLLRVLETGVIERLGGEKPFAVNVRVIAATNKDLAKATTQGLFREDLLFRLNVLPVHIAPLRERLDDLPPLVQHFATRQSARLGRPVRLDAGALQLLAAYGWPGNVRELANLIERLAILATGESITATDVTRVLPSDGRVP